MQIAILDDYQRTALTCANWDSLGAQIVTFSSHIAETADLAAELRPFDVIVAMRERTPFTAQRIGLLPNLRLLVTTGARNASIDVTAARRAGVTVCGTRGTTGATPELTWALILAVTRHITAEDAAIRSGGWQHTVGFGLHGRILGVVGLGRVGRAVAAIGQAFGMEVLAWSHHLTAETAAAAGVTAVGKDDLFSLSDVVTVHYKLSARSAGLVGARELRLMKPTAFLVNTSRGPIVDNDALLAALHAGDIAGAGLDVYDEEPLPAGHSLRSAPRTVLTPHIGYVTDDGYRMFYGDAVEDIAAFAAGRPIRVIEELPAHPDCYRRRDREEGNRSMAQIRPRDLLSDGLLARLGGASPTASTLAGQVLAGDTAELPQGIGPRATAAHITGGADITAAVQRDIGRLADAGYLNVALPPEFGGLGCTLRQAACGQRRLARRAPLTALAVSAHLYWTGAAADAYRAGDNSVRWILLEAARGALFAAGHGTATAGGDLRFADPQSRCEPTGQSGYRFRDPAVLSSLTPLWDWVAVHAIHPADRAGQAGPDTVLAFAGRGSRCTPAFRVARVARAGATGDVFATSAIGWGHAILASVQYSDARRAFNTVVADTTAAGAAAPPPGGGHPLDQWPVAEAGLRLDAMKAKIAEITHPWPLTPEVAPDLGGQRLIAIYAMRHEVAEGAARIRELLAQFTGSPAVATL